MDWQISDRFDPQGALLADRHYSRRTPGSPQFVAPGRCFVLRISDLALWVTHWPKAEYTRHAWPGAWVCALFRNEGAGLSSTLIRSAVAATRSRWDPPVEGMITFVNAQKVKPSSNPGFCFIAAGFEPIGWTKGGHGRNPLRVLRLTVDNMPEAVAPRNAQLRLI